MDGHFHLIFACFQVPKRFLIESCTHTDMESRSKPYWLLRRFSEKKENKRAPTLPPARLPVRPSSLNVFLSSDDFHRLSVLLVVLWLHFAIKTFGHGRCCRFSLEMKKSVRHVTKDSPFSPDSPTNCQQGCSPMTTYTPSTQIQPGTRKVKKKGTNLPLRWWLTPMSQLIETAHSQLDQLVPMNRKTFATDDIQHQSNRFLIRFKPLKMAHTRTDEYFELGKCGKGWTELDWICI